MSGQVMLLWGEDEFGIVQRLSKLEEEFCSPSERMFNIVQLDGRSTSIEELKGALYTLPMFGSRRLVVLTQAIHRFQDQLVRKKFLNLIQMAPESTILVIVEHQKLASDHWMMRWMGKNGMTDSVTAFPLKKGREMAGWIQEQMKQLGGSITPQAAAVLSGLVGDDSRQAYQEINKLLTYVNNARRVDVEDVEAICVTITEANIFAMVDALGNRDGRNAAALMHQLLDERDGLSIFQMIVRQFRMILAARDLLDRGGRINELVSQLRIPDFVARKVWSQARQFSTESLSQIMHSLVELDYQMKMGIFDIDIAMEMFVAELTSSPASDFR